MSKYYIGVDLGGTFIKFSALRDDGGEITSFGFRQCETPADSQEKLVAAMAETSFKLIEDEGLDRNDCGGVGIGAPGPLNRARGVLLNLPNLPGMQNMPLRDMLAESMGMPAVLENDANAAALGEYLFGVGRGVESMVMLTLGTGVGGGIIVDGEIVHGAHDIAGEVGHMIVDPGGRLCNCGQKGCLEQYASATFLAKYAEIAARSGRESILADVIAEKGTIDAADVNHARRKGDALAAEAWNSACRMLAIASINLDRLLDCEMIVLAGGLTKAGDDLVEPIEDFYKQFDWHMTERKSKIAIATLGDKAGVWGAAGVAYQSFHKA